MTREEFIQDIYSWADLINFCSEVGCDVCDDIYDEDGYFSRIREEIEDMLCNGYSWYEIRDYLNELPGDGWDYYRLTDDYEWFTVDDRDFERHKDNTLEWGDEQLVWDEDNNASCAPESYEYIEDETGEKAEQEDISVIDLFSASIEIVHQNIQKVEDADDDIDLLWAAAYIAEAERRA